MRWRKLVRAILIGMAVTGAMVAWYEWVARDPISCVSRANYQRIQVGMSLAEVEELFGSPGEQMPLDRLSNYGDDVVVPGAPPGWHYAVWGDEYYRWTGSEFLIHNYVWMGFRDGRLVSKVIFIHSL
jgi:hypothetical protein